jgi:hypothetical protein
MPSRVESKGRATASYSFFTMPFKARQASSSRTSDVDGLLTRFPGIPIGIPSTTELLHRSPPALNSLSGFAIERAGSAKHTRFILAVHHAKIKRRLTAILGATQQAQTGEPDLSAERVPSVRGSSVC